MIEEAREWNAENPDAPSSWFACRYPGHYKEAAEALSRVRKEQEDE